MVDRIPAMVDLKRTDEDKADFAKDCLPGLSSQPDYPYGLCLSLTEKELEKLNLDDTDIKPGDLVHFHAMAMVTSVSKNANVNQEPHCRLELQITHMSAENEEYENEESEKLDTENHPGRPDKVSRFYGIPRNSSLS